MSSTTFTTYPPAKQASILHDFMELFRGNSRGYGVGEFDGARQREEDNKWTPGHVRWTWGQPGADQYKAHLSGEYLTGIGVLCDDGRVWFSCLDIDDYDIDYGEVMQRIRNTNLPLVVFRTKSGGLRITLFFSEPIEAESVIPRMRRLAASLGYAGCEIFPKQTKLLVDKGDCPSWIYLPYSGTKDIFAEAGCMNDSGNLMEVDAGIAHCMRRRISYGDFTNLFAAEKAADANGRKNGKKHPDRIFVAEGEKQDIVDMIFHDGPVCLRILSRLGVHQGQQNYYLSHCATFLKKKYENWDQPLEWVNYNILQPVGDRVKLDSIIKRWKNNIYEYQCSDEPMRTFCDAHGCRMKKYGVGSDGIDLPELGMTVVLTEPPTFIISAGETRMIMDPTELFSVRSFQIKFLEHGAHIPTNLKQSTHINWINTVRKSATEVKPKFLMRPNASEIELLSEWFARHIPIWVRGPSDDKKDVLRVKEDERRIYFKWDAFATYLRRACNDADVKMMRRFLDSRGEEHAEGRGHWWRYTMSVSFDLFDEDKINSWINPDDEGGEHG